MLLGNHGETQRICNSTEAFPDGIKPLDRLVERCELISKLPAELKVNLKPKDMPILGGAIAGGATHLMTGDQRDFGKFWGKTVQGVKIVSPRMLVEEI